MNDDFTYVSSTIPSPSIRSAQLGSPNDSENEGTFADFPFADACSNAGNYRKCGMLSNEFASVSLLTHEVVTKNIFLKNDFCVTTFPLWGN